MCHLQNKRIKGDKTKGGFTYVKKNYGKWKIRDFYC